MDRTHRSPQRWFTAFLGEELRHNLRIFSVASRGSFSSFAAAFTPASYFGTAVPRYIFQTVFFVILARFAGGPELMRFALLGNAIQIAVNMGLVSMA